MANEKIGKDHPDFEVLKNEWIKAGNPSRFSCGLGNFMILRDNDEMYFLRVLPVDPNLSSFKS